MSLDNASHNSCPSIVTDPPPPSYRSETAAVADTLAPSRSHSNSASSSRSSSPPNTYATDLTPLSSTDGPQDRSLDRWTADEKDGAVSRERGLAFDRQEYRNSVVLVDEETGEVVGLLRDGEVNGEQPGSAEGGDGSKPVEHQPPRPYDDENASRNHDRQPIQSPKPQGYHFSSLTPTPTSSLLPLQRSNDDLTTPVQPPPTSSLALRIDAIIAKIDPTTDDDSLILSHLPPHERIALLKGLTLVDQRLATELEKDARGESNVHRPDTVKPSEFWSEEIDVTKSVVEANRMVQEDEDEEEEEGQDRDGEREFLISLASSQGGTEFDSRPSGSTPSPLASGPSPATIEPASRPLSYGHLHSHIRNSPSDISLQTLRPPLHHRSTSPGLAGLTPLTSPSPTKSTIRRSHARSLLRRSDAVGVDILSGLPGAGVVSSKGGGETGAYGCSPDDRSSIGGSSFYTANDETWRGNVGTAAAGEGGGKGKGDQVLLRFFEQRESVCVHLSSSTLTPFIPPTPTRADAYFSLALPGIHLCLSPRPRPRFLLISDCRSRRDFLHQTTAILFPSSFSPRRTHLRGGLRRRR
jgi:hypothetical protein